MLTAMKTPQSFRESASVCYAVGVLIHMGLAELASLNSRVSEDKRMSAEVCESLVSDFDKVAKHLRNGYDCFVAAAESAS